MKVTSIFLHAVAGSTLAAPLSETSLASARDNGTLLETRQPWCGNAQGMDDKGIGQPEVPLKDRRGYCYRAKDFFNDGTKNAWFWIASRCECDIYTGGDCWGDHSHYKGDIYFKRVDLKPGSWVCNWI